MFPQTLWLVSLATLLVLLWPWAAMVNAQTIEQVSISPIPFYMDDNGSVINEHSAFDFMVLITATEVKAPIKGSIKLSIVCNPDDCDEDKKDDCECEDLAAYDSVTVVLLDITGADKVDDTYMMFDKAFEHQIPITIPNYNKTIRFQATGRYQIPSSYAGSSEITIRAVWVADTVRDTVSVMSIRQPDFNGHENPPHPVVDIGDKIITTNTADIDINTNVILRQKSETSLLISGQAPLRGLSMQFSIYPFHLTYASPSNLYIAVLQLYGAYYWTPSSKGKCTMTFLGVDFPETSFSVIDNARHTTFTLRSSLLPSAITTDSLIGYSATISCPDPMIKPYYPFHSHVIDMEIQQGYIGAVLIASDRTLTAHPQWYASIPFFLKYSEQRPDANIQLQYPVPHMLTGYHTDFSLISPTLLYLYGAVVIDTSESLEAIPGLSAVITASSHSPPFSFHPYTQGTPNDDNSDSQPQLGNAEIGSSVYYSIWHEMGFWVTLTDIECLHTVSKDKVEVKCSKIVGLMDDNDHDGPRTIPEFTPLPSDAAGNAPGGHDMITMKSSDLTIIPKRFKLIYYLPIVYSTTQFKRETIDYTMYSFYTISVQLPSYQPLVQPAVASIVSPSTSYLDVTTTKFNQYSSFLSFQISSWWRDIERITIHSGSGLAFLTTSDLQRPWEKLMDYCNVSGIPMSNAQNMCLRFVSDSSTQLRYVELFPCVAGKPLIPQKVSSFRFECHRLILTTVSRDGQQIDLPKNTLIPIVYTTEFKRSAHVSQQTASITLQQFAATTPPPYYPKTIDIPMVTTVYNPPAIPTAIDPSSEKLAARLPIVIHIETAAPFVTTDYPYSVSLTMIHTKTRESIMKNRVVKPIYDYWFIDPDTYPPSSPITFPHPRQNPDIDGDYLTYYAPTSVKNTIGSDYYTFHASLYLVVDIFPSDARSEYDAYELSLFFNGMYQHKHFVVIPFRLIPMDKSKSPPVPPFFQYESRVNNIGITEINHLPPAHLDQWLFAPSVQLNNIPPYNDSRGQECEVVLQVFGPGLFLSDCGGSACHDYSMSVSTEYMSTRIDASYKTTNMLIWRLPPHIIGMGYQPFAGHTMTFAVNPDTLSQANTLGGFRLLTDPAYYKPDIHPISMSASLECTTRSAQQQHDMEEEQEDSTHQSQDIPGVNFSSIEPHDAPRHHLASTTEVIASYTWTGTRPEFSYGAHTTPSNAVNVIQSSGAILPTGQLLLHARLDSITPRTFNPFNDEMFLRLSHGVWNLHTDATHDEFSPIAPEFSFSTDALELDFDSLTMKLCVYNTLTTVSCRPLRLETYEQRASWFKRLDSKTIVLHLASPHKVIKSMQSEIDMGMMDLMDPTANQEPGISGPKPGDGFIEIDILVSLLTPVAITEYHSDYLFQLTTFEMSPANQVRGGPSCNTAYTVPIPLYMVPLADQTIITPTIFIPPPTAQSLPSLIFESMWDALTGPTPQTAQKTGLSALVEQNPHMISIHLDNPSFDIYALRLQALGDDFPYRMKLLTSSEKPVNQMVLKDCKISVSNLNGKTDPMDKDLEISALSTYDGALWFTNTNPQLPLLRPDHILNLDCTDAKQGPLLLANYLITQDSFYPKEPLISFVLTSYAHPEDVSFLHSPNPSQHPQTGEHHQHPIFPGPDKPPGPHIATQSLDGVNHSRPHTARYRYYLDTWEPSHLPDNNSSNKVLIIVLCTVLPLLALAIGGGGYLWYRRSRQPSDSYYIIQ